MRTVRVLVAFALCFNLPLTATLQAQDNVSQGSSPTSRSSLLAKCEETVVEAAPLEPRPVLRRATHAYKPGRPHARRATHHSKPAHKPVAGKKIVKKVAAKKTIRKTAARKPAGHALANNRPVAHRPARVGDRPVLQRVTFASPLCGERTQAISDLIGFDSLAPFGLSEAPLATASSDTTNNGQAPLFDLPPVLSNTSGGGSSPSPFFPGGGSSFPGGGFGGGGPIIIAPGVPATPVVTPNTPLIPDVTDTPTSPDVPGLPVVPGSPDAPGVPVIPGGPDVPGIPFTPIVPDSPLTPVGPDVPGVPVIPGTPDVPGTPVVPGGPLVPGGPDVLNPPVATPPGAPDTPVGPVVTPTPSAVPEPANWTMMLLGMGLVGGSIRRRQQTMARG